MPNSIDTHPLALLDAQALMPSKRLAYLTTGQGDIVATAVDWPDPLKAGEVLCELVSLTPCSTDKSNVWGALGHTIAASDPVIIGHESCYRVVKSLNPAVPVGSYVVTLGDDFWGLVKCEKFFLVLSSTDPKTIPLEFSSRATYFDPIPHVKAAVVVKGWFSGVSLVEPVTHVLTAFYHTRAAMFADNMVVLGGGFCGQVACILAKLFGVQRVTLVDVSQSRIDFAIRHGFADEGVNAADETRIEALIEESQGAYSDVVFDALPGIGGDKPDTRSMGARLLRPGGTWLMYAAAHQMRLPTITLLAKGIVIEGAPYDSREISFTRRAAHMRLALDLIQSGAIPVGLFIARQIDFFDAAAVRRAILEHGCGDEIKVEIVVG